MEVQRLNLFWHFHCRIDTTLGRLIHPPKGSACGSRFVSVTLRLDTSCHTRTKGLSITLASPE
jgi:hypothetical protein